MPQNFDPSFSLSDSSNGRKLRRLDALAFQTRGTSTSWHLERSLDVDHRTIGGPSVDRAKNDVEHIPRSLDRFHVYDSFLATPQCPRAGAIEEAKLLVSPHGLRFVGSRLPDASSTANGFPVARAFDVQLVESLIDGANEFVHLFQRVARCHCDSEALRTNCDGGIIDRLDIDVMVTE